MNGHDHTFTELTPQIRCLFLSAPRYKEKRSQSFFHSWSSIIDGNTEVNLHYTHLLDNQGFSIVLRVSLIPRLVFTLPPFDILNSSIGSPAPEWEEVPKEAALLLLVFCFYIFAIWGKLICEEESFTKPRNTLKYFTFLLILFTFLEIQLYLGLISALGVAFIPTQLF